MPAATTLLSRTSMTRWPHASTVTCCARRVTGAPPTTSCKRTLLQIHRKRGSYVAGLAVLPWAYAIARRLCIDEFRRRKTDMLWSRPRARRGLFSRRQRARRRSWVSQARAAAGNGAAALARDAARGVRAAAHRRAHSRRGRASTGHDGERRQAARVQSIHCHSRGAWR